MSVGQPIAPSSAAEGGSVNATLSGGVQFGGVPNLHRSRFSPRFAPSPNTPDASSRDRLNLKLAIDAEPGHVSAGQPCACREKGRQSTQETSRSDSTRKGEGQTLANSHRCKDSETPSRFLAICLGKEEHDDVQGGPSLLLHGHILGVRRPRSDYFFLSAPSARIRTHHRQTPRGYLLGRARADSHFAESAAFLHRPHQCI